MQPPAVLYCNDDGLFSSMADEPEIQGPATAIAIGERAVWVIADGDLWSGTPGSWTKTAAAPRPLRCVAEARGSVYAGSADAHLYRLEDGELCLLEGFERAPGRDDWYTPWGGPPDVRSIAEHDGALFVNVHVGGILRSEDGGATWSPTIDIHCDVHQVAGAGAGLLAAASARGLALSDDGGGSWRFESAGLHASYARAVAAGGDMLFLSASDGPRAGRGALYRRPAAGRGELERCSDFYPGNIDTGCVAARGRDAALGTPSGSVLTSRDSGDSWAVVASGSAPVRAVAFAPGGGRR